jgi:hypothetical protein
MNESPAVTEPRAGYSYHIPQIKSIEQGAAGEEQST